MAYTTINKSSLQMNTKLYTGNSSQGRSITGIGFLPSMVWAKCRNAANNNHILSDSVRGTNKNLQPNTGSAQIANNSQGWVSAFGSDGFTAYGGSGGYNEINGNNNTYAAWNWKGGATSNIATNGATTITPSAYNFNQTSGFSIIKYTGNATSGAKVPHGLGVAPKMVITKKVGGTSNWVSYHAGVNNGSSPQNYAMSFNYNYAKDGESYYWNNTAPDAVNFTLGSSTQVNDGGNGGHIAYCFADIPGYSKFGNYKGNGNVNKGTFIYTGFKPQFLITKRDDNTSGGSWLIYDTQRDPSNTADIILTSEGNSTEAGWGNTFDIDILSNGFKMRSQTTYTNVNNANYIFMAFGQSLVGSNNVAATAR